MKRGDLFSMTYANYLQVAKVEGAVQQPRLAEVQEATAAERHPAVATEEKDDSGMESGTEDEAGSEDGKPAPSESRSFASTYWRPERNDRNANLSVIDER